MKRYLLDMSALLDLILNRAPWAADVQALWDAHLSGHINLVVAAFSIPTVFYIVRRQSGLTGAVAAVNSCMATLDIAPTDQTTLSAAQAMSGSDFEDNLQIASAIQAGVDGIITRDPRGFASSPLPVLTPADVVATLPAPPTP